FDLPGFHRRFLDATGTEAPYERFRATFLGAVRERPAMIAFLDTLPDRYRVGMLSNNVPTLCDTVRDDPRFARIERFVFSNEIGVRKPDPAAFAALEEALGVPPSETVFVDDSATNVAAAEKLGYRAVLLDDLDRFGERWARAVPDVPPPVGPESDA
ncbi:MAG: HAD-IA family hydrolase, partial [Trueperaceae bacterium]